MIKMVKGGIPGCHANVEDVYRMYAKDTRFQPKGKDEEVECRGSRVEGRGSKVEPFILEPVQKAIDASAPLHVGALYCLLSA